MSQNTNVQSPTTFTAGELAAQGYNPSTHPALEGAHQTVEEPRVIDVTAVESPATTVEVITLDEAHVAEVVTDGLRLAAACRRHALSIDPSGVVRTPAEEARGDNLHPTRAY